MKTSALFTPHLLETLKPRPKEYTLHDASCEGLALRVQPSGAMSWVYWERINKRTRKHTLGRFPNVGLDDARAAYRRTKESGGAQVARPLLGPDTITFADLCTAFLAAKDGVYSKRAHYSSQVYIRTQLRPAFGTKPLNKITTPDIAHWFYAYAEERSGGANQALGLFTTMLNWGKADGIVPYDLPNPASPIRSIPRRARGRMLSAKQLGNLATALDDAGQSQRVAADAIWLILLTGCRSGEILRLKWSEVRPDRLKLTRTKTGPREVPLSDAALQRLDGLREHRSSAYVFPAPRDSTRPRTSINGAWATLKREADLPPDIRLHDLRHTYASHAIMSGETLSMTGKLLGHASLRSTERYAHLDAAYLAKAAEKVSKEVDKLMSGF